jgi:hypothetical protein
MPSASRGQQAQRVLQSGQQPDLGDSTPSRDKRVSRQQDLSGPRNPRTLIAEPRRCTRRRGSSAGMVRLTPAACDRCRRVIHRCCPGAAVRAGRALDVTVVWDVWDASWLAPPWRGCTMMRCESTSSSGRRTESTILTGTALRRRRSNRLALGTLWYSVPSPRAKTRFTTYSDKPMPAGTCSVWSSSFRTERGIRSRLGQ